MLLQLSLRSRHANEAKGSIQWIRSDEGLARNVSFRISLRWPIHIINPVDETKLSCYTSHRRSTTVSLETYPSIQYNADLTLSPRLHVKPLITAITAISADR